MSVQPSVSCPYAASSLRVAGFSLTTVGSQGRQTLWKGTHGSQFHRRMLSLLQKELQALTLKDRADLAPLLSTELKEEVTT